MSDLNRTLIVLDADKPVAMQTGADAGGGAGMFSVPLAATAAPTVITHWGCSGMQPQSVLDVMWPSACIIQDADVEDVFVTITRLGLVMWQDPNA